MLSLAITLLKVASMVAAALLDSAATLDVEEHNIHGLNREWSGISAGSDIVCTSNRYADDYDLEEAYDLSDHHDEIRARANKLLSWVSDQQQRCRQQQPHQQGGEQTENKEYLSANDYNHFPQVEPLQSDNKTMKAEVNK